MGNTTSKKPKPYANLATHKRNSASRCEEPFAQKQGNTAILVRRGSTTPMPSFLQDLGTQFVQGSGGDETSKNSESTSAVRTIDVHGEFNAQALDLPREVSLLTVLPRRFFSRHRNVQAEKWRNKAHERADAFVYTIEMGGQSEEEYYASDGQERGHWYRGLPWESDRFAISDFLGHPRVREHPRKPFLLLVQADHLTPDFSMERLVNLLGLGRIRRPFRTATYCIDPETNQGKRAVMSSLAWIQGLARDDGTAATERETEEDASIATMSTSFSGDEVAQSLDPYVMDYEPTLQGGNPTLQRFEPLKRNSPCPFARGAKLWGGKTVNDEESKAEPSASVPYKRRVEHAAVLNAGPLSEFVALVHEGEPLDGYCLEIPDGEYETGEKLGEKVGRLLAKLAELDPMPGENAMRMGPIERPEWRFRFAGEDFFVTTFSPRYPEDSSRQTFGASKSFMLFQPMTSFGRHGLKEDTPATATNWTAPKTMRDKARVAFKERGCPYFIPEELPYPVAEHIVKPVKDDGRSVVKWWEAPAAIAEGDDEGED